MVDPNKKDDAPESEVKDMDDKSINELLKEYAEDVKDRDLDEFLKDSPEDDAFEGDHPDADDDAAVAAPKKSGGFLTFLMFLVVVGAAGAGAWIYLNKDEGMTNVMGGFAPSDDASSAMNTPPLPDATPSMPGTDVATDVPPADTAIVSPFPEELPQTASDVPSPTPILNETTDATVPATTDTAEAPVDAAAAVPALAPVDEQPAADVATDVTAPAADVTATTETPAPAQAEVQSDTTASAAVNDWMSTASDGMAETDAKLGAAPAASEPTTEAGPAVEIAEVNAKPVDKIVETKQASAPKQARAASPYDDALPPPYVAIKAGKSVSSTAATTTTTSTDTAARMAPVVEGSSGIDAGNGEVYKKRGSTAATEPAETRATGVYKDLVKQGGGSIELPGLVANVQNDITVGQVQQPAPVAANPAASMPVDNVPMRLAIQGGKSLPPEMTARTPTGTVSAVLPQQLQAEPTVPAVPVESVQTETPSRPVASAPAPRETAPAATTSEAGEPSAALRSVIQQAIAAEKSGDKAGAIALYQRALELDATEGGQLDRGMVYDRIGALRAQ